MAWLAADRAIGMTAGLTANSVALIGWGLDCAIEAVASFAIIWRFTGVRIQSANAERLAQKIVLFHLLLGYLITRTLLVLVRVFTRLQHRLDQEPESALWQGMHCPTTWDPFFASYMTLAAR